MRTPFRSTQIALLAVPALLLPLTLSSCMNSGRATSELACDDDFGATVEARRLESFLRASADLHDGALATETDLLTTCRAMGVDLGMTDAEIFAGGSSGEGSASVRTACTNVDARIRADLDAVRAGASVLIELDVTPPRCEVSVEAYASCVAECDVDLDPGSVELTCEGGELRGRCDAECTGSCAVDVDGACAGTCEGSCEGDCSVRADDESCAGACAGTCHGRCVVRAEASCTGECRGDCSVSFVEPTCTGDVRAPMASAHCQADCDARVAADVACTPGSTHLRITGLASADAMARAERLRVAFETGAASVSLLRARAELLLGSATVFVSTASDAPGDAAALGAAAVGCAAASAVEVADAALSLRVSVSVTVMVSGTISAAAE
jgi:hypothetical protein